MEQSIINALARMGHGLNAEYLKPWAEELGALVVNFGGIEILTYQYLVLLERDTVALERHFERLLGPRIDRILGLLSAATYLPEAERQLAMQDWTEVRKMADWRNHIAHNPVLPYWGPEQDPHIEPPQGMTMPDIRDLPRGAAGVHVTLDLLKELVGVSANLSRRLGKTAAAISQKDRTASQS